MDKLKGLAGLSVFFLLFSLTFVIAEEIEKPLEISGNAPFSLSSWVRHTFGIGPFSVVGDSRRCSSSASKTLHVPSQTSAVYKASTYCSSGFGIVDYFSPNWNPWKEYKDIANVQCGSSGDCNVEVYCCSSNEPTSDGECIIKYGSNSRLKTATCTSWINNGYKCTTIYGTESSIPYELSSFKYCSQNVAANCYYYSGSGNTCTLHTYPGEQFCPASYQGSALYSSKSTCENNIPAGGGSGGSGGSGSCTPSCSGKACGSDGCGGSCGACAEGQACSSNQCVASGQSTDNQNPETGGVKENIVASDIVLPKSPQSSPSKESIFKVHLKNQGTASGTIKVEAGFYTYQYAKDVAKLFSVFPTYSIVGDIQNCVNEPFVRTKEVTLDPGEEIDVEIKVAPLNAYVTLEKNKEYDLEATKLTSFLGVMYNTGENACCKKLPGFEGCAEGTGGYRAVDYDSSFYIKPSFVTPLTESIFCAGEEYGKIKYNIFSVGAKVFLSKDYHECIDYTFYTPEGQLNETATQDYKDASGNLNYINVKKISLTKEEISKATNTQLLASTCLKPEECLDKKNYTISCSSIRSLRDDGTLTESKSNSFFSDAKTTINKGIIGSTIGGAIGVIACGAIAVATSGTGAVACSALIYGGAAVGAGVGISISNLNQNDDLIKELKASNDNAVGICTAEPAAFDLGNFLKSVGKIVKITGNESTDGLILIIGGIFLITILLSILTKK